MPRVRRVLTGFQVVVVVLAIVLIDVGITGYVVFTNAPDDPLERADAIVVLGGEHDGREDYALGLAKEGWAPTVVFSNSYLASDQVMQRVCRDAGVGARHIEVMCPVPSSLTTRGEAIMVRKLADERSWSKIIVVSWKYHLPRARLIFRQCFTDQPVSTIMRAMPRHYEFSPFVWEVVFTYQLGALAKAIWQGECS